MNQRVPSPPGFSQAEIARAVGARLRELRVDAEITIDEMAALIGSHRPIVCRIEVGVAEHMPSLETIQRYAHVLGLDLADILVCLDPAWRAADETTHDGFTDRRRPQARPGFSIRRTGARARFSVRRTLEGSAAQHG